MADIYEARIEVLTEENENIRRMLRRLKDTLLYKEKEVESLRVLLKECKNYIPYSFPYLQTERYVDTDPDKLNLIARINIAIGEMPKEECNSDE